VRGASVDREKAKLQPSPIILLTTARVPPAKLRQLRALVDEVKICGRTELNFRFAFRWLRRKWGVRRLLCEGGGALNGTLFHADLVDELHLTLCPKIFGGRNAPTLADGPGVLKLADATQLQLKSFKRVGDELFLIYRRVPGG
jgi:riboflavin-specific deaminase-like protein